MSEEPKAVARSTDPGTSWEAARGVKGIRESQAELLSIYRRMGPMTDEQMIGILGTQGSKQSPSGIRTRRSELVDAGLVRASGRLRRGSTGRRMIVWEAQGREGWPQDGVPDHLVRYEREGKADVYVNPRKAQAEVLDNKRKADLEAEEKRLRATPRVDRASLHVTFGGPLPCDKCAATGGNLLEACVYCNGTGLR